MADDPTNVISQSESTNEATQPNSWLNKIRTIFQWPFATKDVRGLVGEKQLWVVVVGLDGSGLTSVMKQLGQGDVTQHAPRDSFRIESLEYKNMKIDSFVIGGGDKYRPMKEGVLGAARLIVWVVDSAERDFILESREELRNFTRSHNESHAVYLILANKQDVPGALTPAEISEQFKLAALTHQSWHVQPTCALTGQGIFEGFEWLIHEAEKAGHTVAASHDLRTRAWKDAGDTQDALSRPGRNART